MDDIVCCPGVFLVRNVSGFDGPCGSGVGRDVWVCAVVNGVGIPCSWRWGVVGV